MKKILAVMLVLLLIVGGFAGCGSDEASETETPAETEAPVEEPAEDEDDPEEDPEEEDEPEEEPEDEPEEEPEDEADEAASGDDTSSISVVFMEDGSVLTLGDDKASIDAILGEGTENGDYIFYLDGTFSVRYADDIAATFVGVDFEQMDFLAFDTDRSISSIMRDLMFDPFVEYPSMENAYTASLEIGDNQYALVISVGLTDGELSHVESIVVDTL